MEALFNSLIEFVVSGWNVVSSLFLLVLPWTPLLVWIAFWMMAVDWVRLRTVLLQGGWFAVLFLGLVTVLIWGTIAPPPDGSHYVFGLTLSNYVGKTVYVTSLICLMLISGAMQLSGVCPSCCRFAIGDEPTGDAAAH